MKYIIMCGGKYSIWETPRQLTVIFGESIVGRTIRLLRENAVDDIAISTNDVRFEQFDVPLLHHRNDFDTEGHGCWADAFYPTDEAVCYIMGDVLFSPEAIRTIVSTRTDSIQFFASAPPFARAYIKPYAEPFAFKVADQKRFRAAIDFVRANENTGIFTRRPIAWELWQVINGEDVTQINFNNYKAINDYTCDIDKKSDAKELERVLSDSYTRMSCQRMVCK